MKVTLLDHCASDLAVVNAARVSYDRHSDELSEADERLIGHLLRNGHGTPFEHGYLRFRVECPIFVAREWMRHRIGHSYNEVSGRLSALPERVYAPRELRANIGRRSEYRFEPLNDPGALALLEGGQHRAWDLYHTLLGRGVAHEQARTVLPLGAYTAFYWSCNPRSLMHFCELRANPAAMTEIRELAVVAEESFAALMPVTHHAWRDARPRG